MERGTPMEKTIAVLGGDRRMALLARLLAEDGHPVRTWGLAAFGMEDTADSVAANLPYGQQLSLIHISEPTRH